MLKRIFKAFTVSVTVFCLVVCMLPTYAFADVVEFTEAAKMGATIVDLYGAANNTSLAYESLTEGSALTVIETLYQDYSSSVSDPYTLAAIGAAAAAAGTIAVVYDAITGKGYIQLYQTQYVSSLDGFWDYTLSDLGLLRNNDGFFEWTFNQNDVVEPLIVSRPISPLPQLPTSGLTNQQYYDQSTPAITTSDTPDIRYYRVSSDGNYTCYAFIVYTGSVYEVYIISQSNGYIGRYSSWNGNSTYLSENLRLRYTSNSLYYVKAISSGWSLVASYLPIYSSLSDGTAAFLQYFSNGFPAVACQPEFYVGDPLTAVPTITVPDVAGDPEYAPQPLRINTDIEWLPEWGDPYGVPNPEPGVPYPVTDPAILNVAVPEIWKAVVEGVEVSPEADPDPDPDPDPDNPGPDEVFNPLLPVTLPSFNFSFSGIWHYVREWVSSLGAWFTTLFLIWSKLPYAMVVPVYATAVVVIVLGVYKRFFM